MTTASTLRVVHRDAPAPQAGSLPEPSQQTLLQLWETTILPAIHIREPDPARFLRTNGSYYRVTLRAWEDAMGPVPISAIDDVLLSEWRAKLMQRPGRYPGSTATPATMRRHWRYLRAMLRMLYERRVIDRVPHIKMPRVELNPGDQPIVEPEIWSALCDACRVWSFSTDRRLPGPLVGRGVLIWLWSTGLRATDLFSLDRADVHTSRRCPVQRLAHLQHEHGWLYTVASKTNKPVLIPLTAPARQWFDLTGKMLPKRDRQAGRLLPLGSPRPDCRDAHLRHYSRIAIHAAAGVEPVHTFQELRAAANEAWNTVDEEAGEWLLGHAANRNVNSRHYRNGVRKLLTAVQRLDVPEAFLRLE